MDPGLRRDGRGGKEGNFRIGILPAECLVWETLPSIWRAPGALPDHPTSAARAALAAAAVSQAKGGRRMRKGGPGTP